MSWTLREEGGFCLHQRLTAHLLLELATCAPHNSSLPSPPCTSTRGPSSHGVLHVPTFPGLRTPGGKAGLPFLPNTTVPSSQHRPLPWPPPSEILQGRNRPHFLIHTPPEFQKTYLKPSPGYSPYVFPLFSTVSPKPSRELVLKSLMKEERSSDGQHSGGLQALHLQPPAKRQRPVHLLGAHLSLGVT